jgi:hypothetical protein
MMSTGVPVLVFADFLYEGDVVVLMQLSCMPPMSLRAVPSPGTAGAPCSLIAPASEARPARGNGC